MTTAIFGQIQFTSHALLGSHHHGRYSFLCALCTQAHTGYLSRYVDKIVTLIHPWKPDLVHLVGRLIHCHLGTFQIQSIATSPGPLHWRYSCTMPSVAVLTRVWGACDATGIFF